MPISTRVFTLDFSGDLCSVAAFVNITLEADHFDRVSGSGFSVLGDHCSPVEK